MRPVVIIATLGLDARPTLRDTLRCILNQTVPCEVITWSGGVNEYEARNEACRKALAGHSPEETVFIFVDDDTTPPPDYVERMTKHFEDQRVMAATCGLKGNFWGAGEMEVSMPYWAIGATLAVRGSAFLEMGGFEVDWGVRPPPRGWRGDSVGKDIPILIRQQDGTIKFYTISEYSQKFNFYRLEDGKEYAIPKGDMILSFDGKHIEWKPITLVVRHKVNKVCKVKILGFSEIIITADHSLITPVFKTDNGIKIRMRSQNDRGDLNVLVDGKIQKNPYYIKTNKWQIAKLLCIKPTIGERVFISATEYELPEMKYIPFKITDLTRYDSPLNHYAVKFDGIEEVAKKIHWRKRHSIWYWQKNRALPIRLLQDLGVDLNNIEKCEILCKGNHKTLKYSYPIPLTDDLIKFFGLWIADGSYHPNGVSISCRKAKDLISKVSSLFKAKYSVKKNGVDYNIYSRFLRRIMEILGFQGSAYTKRIPDFIFNMSKRQRKIFLDGYFMGDGHEDEATTVNRRLAEEIQALLSSVGIVSSVRKYTCTTPYSNQPTTFFIVRKLSKNVHSKVISVPTDIGYIYLGKIASIEEIEYNDYVYDFHVQDSSNFFINTLLVHNSDIVCRIIDRYGYGSYVHDFSLKNIHPGMMGAVWQPAVEERFYMRHRNKVLRYIAPYDPRLRSFVVQRGLERDDRVVRLFTHDQAPRLEWVRREIHMLDYLLRGDVKILDVGGEDGFLFAGTGWDYTVMDIDLYDVPDGRFVRHDADTDWPFPDRSFDVVVLGEVLEHVERPDHVWSEACRVARHMVLATVPNEYEWSGDKAPLLMREERMRRDGFTDIDEMARSFASKSSHLLELTSEKVKPHLWHRRWFTRDELQRLVGDAEIGDIRFGGWAWWTVKKTT